MEQSASKDPLFWWETPSPSAHSELRSIKNSDLPYARYLERLCEEGWHELADLSQFFNRLDKPDQWTQLPDCQWSQHPICECKDGAVIFAQSSGQTIETMLHTHGISQMEPTELHAAVACLRNPSDSVQSQIIILQPMQEELLIPILDQLGTLYDIDPTFCAGAIFDVSLRSRCQTKTFVSSTQRSFVIAQDEVAAQVFERRLANNHKVNVIMIYIARDFEDRDGLRDVRTQRPTIHKSKQPAIHDWCPSRNLRSDITPQVRHLTARAYLFRLSQWSTKTIEFANENPYMYLFPLVEPISKIHVLSTTSLNGSAEINSIEEERKLLQNPDIKFRAWEVKVLGYYIERFERFYVQFRSKANVSEDRYPAYFKTKATDVQERISFAKTELCFHREALQLEVDVLSIEASKNSISEAIAVKRLSQLAFFFIPLSYVNSLYGMNIAEWTGSGVKFWIFVATSVAITILTFLFWQAFDSFANWRQTNGAVRWANHWDLLKESWTAKRMDDFFYHMDVYGYRSFRLIEHCWQLFQRLSAYCKFDANRDSNASRDSDVRSKSQSYIEVGGEA